MIKWYANLAKKQRVILWVAALLLSAFPMIGWLFVAPWLIPLMLFLEFKHESVRQERMSNRDD